MGKGWGSAVTEWLVFGGAAHAGDLNLMTVSLLFVLLLAHHGPWRCQARSAVSPNDPCHV